MQVRGGLTEKVEQDHVVRLHFTDVGKLPPPVLQFATVTFGYSKDNILYRDVRERLAFKLHLALCCPAPSLVPTGRVLSAHPIKLIPF